MRPAGAGAAVAVGSAMAVGTDVSVGARIGFGDGVSVGTAVSARAAVGSTATGWAATGALGSAPQALAIKAITPNTSKQNSIRDFMATPWVMTLFSFERAVSN